MNNLYNFVSLETAIEILRSDIWDSETHYIGAIIFVSKAFAISVDSLLERISVK